MSISINVDPANPGQFFACCGLLELADRLWGGAEGWFEDNGKSFHLACIDSADVSFQSLANELQRTGLSGELTPILADERAQLEKKKKETSLLTKDEEKRRKELGTLLREGAIEIGAPFNLRLDWYQEDSNDNPKTWAGRQEVLRIATSALLSSVNAFAAPSPFDFSCVMRPASDSEDEDTKPKTKQSQEKKKKKVEPFYFDSRHGCSALPLDIGFSTNELGMESKAFPAVELMCLIGIQRCRPKPTNTVLVFEYFTWSDRLGTSVAPAAVNGLIGQRFGYRFENAYRTDQKKHSGYLPATQFWR